MRSSTPKILPTGIDHVLMRYCNLIRPGRRAGLIHRREPLTQVMRVISGKYRSRPLKSLPGLDVRPTSDRLRETLFNVLTAGNPQALEGSVWIDLFAGTGAVGIEALSRGAAMVYFIEHSRPAAELIQQNLRSLDLQAGFRLLQKDALHAIEQLDAQGVRANLVFLDPPYKLQDIYWKTLDALGQSKLAAGAEVIVEHEKRFEPGDGRGAMHRTRRLDQGDAALSFYSREPSVAN